jgi:long-chain acyl-CoA synthetase
MTTPWDQRLGVWYVAEDHPELPAIVECPSGETLTFGELAARAHQIANALQAAGLRRGEVITLAFPNGLDTVLWQLACQEIGLYYVMLNPALSAFEVRSIMDHAEAAAVVIHTRYADRAEELDQHGSARVRLSVGGPVPGFTSAEDLLAAAPRTPPSERSCGLMMVYTSGTTARPKGIWRPLPQGDPSETANAQKVFGHAFRMMPLEGAHLVSAGMYHGGCTAYYMGALNVGQPLAILERFDPERCLQAIEQHRVTTAYMVPTQFVRLLKLPDDVRARYDTSSLQVVVHSAAPCPRDVKSRMFEWWGPVIWETYGGTEGAATIAKPHHWLAKPGTVGRAVRGITVRILDDDGNPLPPLEVGHIYIESAAGRTFKYLNDDEATTSVYRGASFTLGDMGYLDHDGFLFISDRLKDMIITGGVNVYPAEVEGVLAAHPKVHDAAVIGVPDDEWGESVKAVVQPAPGVTPSLDLAEELIAHCRGRLAHYKCPRSVDFRAELPRTEAGKLYKRKIRDEYWAAAGRQV